MDDEMEILLVDDGSTDKSPVLCDYWSSLDHRIKVFHQDNQGLSAARNTGINHAKGEYITFIDSDDYIGDDTLTSIINKLKENPQIDLIEYPAILHYGSQRQSRLILDDNSYHDLATYWLHGTGYQHSYAWNKIYRRSLFDHVRFPQGVLFEDAHTIPSLVRLSRLTVTTTEGLYYYNENPKGITTTASGKTLASLLDAHINMLSELNGNDDETQRYYMDVLNIQMDVYEQTGEKPLLPYRKIRIKLFRDKYRYKAIALRLLGVNGICILNKLIHKIWKNH